MLNHMLCAENRMVTFSLSIHFLTTLDKTLQHFLYILIEAYLVHNFSASLYLSD